MPLNTTLKKIPFALILQGMINILHGLGLRFLALGHNTPFMVRKWFCFHIDASSSASVFFCNCDSVDIFLSSVHSTSACLTTTEMSARPSRQWGIVGTRSLWDSCPNLWAPSHFVSLELEMFLRYKLTEIKKIQIFFSRQSYYSKCGSGYFPNIRFSCRGHKTSSMNFLWNM